MINRTLRPIAAAVALANISIAAPVLAQEEQALEEIIVTGIRTSLVRAMDVKRGSDGIVDAISAEDIGKFPDTNLAESLQRIPGVSIDRVNNEGARVTVRGFGPEFNMVTLNNRVMPAAATDRNVNSARAFNFNEIAADSISGVQVYKTGSADKTSGGIGSVINITTAKPLDFAGTKATFNAKMMNDTTVESGDDLTPELSGLFSTTFADDTFGVLITGSYQERHNRQEISAVDGWKPNQVARENIDFSAVGGDTGHNVWSPQNYNIDVSDHQRERINGQLVLEWAPSEKIRAAVDYTYSSFDDEIERNQLGVWFNGGPAFASGAVDENGTLVNFVGTGSNQDYFGYSDHIETENNSVGFNLEWDVSDSVSLSFDYHSSKSEAQPDGINGDSNEMFTIIGAPGAAATSMDFGNGNELPGLGFDYGGIDPYDPANIKSLFVANNLTENTAEVDQFQFDGVWRNEGDSGLREIQFGMGVTDYSTRLKRYQTQRSSGYYSDFPVQDNMDFDNWKLNSISGLLSDFSGTETLPPYMYEYDVPNEIERANRSYDSLEGTLHPAYGNLVTHNYLTTFYPEDLKQDHSIEESTFHTYLQMVFEADFNGMPFNARAGVRWDRTDVTSKSLSPAFTTLQWNTGNEMQVLNTGDINYTDVESDYDYFLPNLDMSLEVMENVVTRMSYSTTISRPDINAMREAVSFGETKAYNNITASTGDSELKPYESQNLDLGVEWYYAEASYFAVGYFRKEVDNFIVYREGIQNILDVRNPALGPRTTQAIADLAAAGGDTNDQSAVLAQVRANETAAGRNPNQVQGSAAFGDPLADVSVSKPRNEESVSIDGWEIAVQHMFGESGFGVIANATFVDGDVDFPVNEVGDLFALPGLSDSYNLVGFYDKNGFQARVAYNYRDEFLYAIGQLRQQNEPIHTEEYGQWDVSASYTFKDAYTVYFEGINVTEESVRQYGRWDNQLVRAEQGGARYALGFRYNF